MADFTHVSCESLLKSNCHWTNLYINFKMTNLRLYLYAGEILKASKCHVVFQNFDLHVIAQSNQKCLYGFVKISQVLIGSSE